MFQSNRLMVIIKLFNYRALLLQYNQFLDFFKIQLDI